MCLHISTHTYTISYTIECESTLLCRDDAEKMAAHMMHTVLFRANMVSKIMLASTHNSYILHIPVY